MVFLTTIIVLFKYGIFPLEKKHKLETLELENKKNREIVLLSELSPDPVLRVDAEGKILLRNTAAYKLFNINDDEGKPIDDIVIFGKKLPWKQFCETGGIEKFDFNYKGIFFKVYIEGFPDLRFTQIYITNIDENIRYQNKIKELTDYIEKIQEAERDYLARNLHDGLGQIMASLHFSMNKLQTKFTLPGELDNEVKILGKKIEAAQEQFKYIISDLLPKEFARLGLMASLETLIEMTQESKGIRGVIQVHGQKPKLSESASLEIFRMLQEIITNITKHSGAGSFIITFLRENGNLEITVSDDGKGFEFKGLNQEGWENKFGLFSIHERMKKLKGEVTIDTAPGSGTDIILSIPVDGGNGS